MSRQRTLLLIAIIVIPALAVYGLNPEMRSTLGLLARADIAPLRDYVLAWGIWAPVISTLLQIITSVIAPLPSFVVTFVNAMVFGFWWGALLTYTTALLAAAICFGMARALGRPVVERFATKRALDATDHFFAKHGAQAVLIARLIPFVNPDVLSYAAGLTNMSWTRFMTSIAIGSIPSTLLYSYLGARGITQIGWLMIPLVGLGLLTLLAAIFRRRPQVS